MSPDEKRTQKADVLLEYQEVEDDLNALLVRSARQGELISQFGQMLLNSPAEHIMKADQPQHGSRAVPIPNQMFIALAEWEKAFEIADGIRFKRLRLQELKRQKEALGLR
jgi:hypothetical protein